LVAREPILVRNPQAVRPWQHVLEALGGYLQLAALLANDRGKEFEGAWNFGPNLESHRTVQELVRAVVANWGSGSVRCAANHGQPQPVEAHSLVLNCDKVRQQLGGRPRWDFAQAVRQTVAWYREYGDSAQSWELTARQIETYTEAWAISEVLQETA
jgi:CDP-glucose 4,6-dehydratase